jgi:hypothetical protein
MKTLISFLAIFCLSISLSMGQERPAYSGSHHTSSHGGHYSGGSSGSSHKGAHYTAPNGYKGYGKHKK